MKHLLISALMATACTLGAAAQSVVVTDAEGIAHKFSAERVKDITFIKTSAEDVTVFNTVDARIYSSGAVEATFTNSDNQKAVTLWIVGPSMGKFLYEGVYTVSSDGSAMTIDSDKNYSFVTENGSNTALTAGTMNVALNGKEYTITFDLSLADGNTLKGKYVGEMPDKVGKDIKLPDMDAPKVQTTEISGYVPGEFYVKGNDASWNYETALDFYADASEAKLPAGIYTYSTDNTPGTFGSKSYLDLYSPSCNYHFAEGSTVTVDYNDGNIVMTVKLVTAEDGRTIEYGYTGPITFPEVEQQKETIALETAAAAVVKDVNNRVAGEYYVKMNDASWNYEMAVDLFADASTTKLPAGTYTYSTDNSPGTFGPKSYLDLYTPNIGSCRFAEGSTVTVAYDGDNIVLTLDLVIADKNYVATMTYNGAISYEF